MKSTMKIVVMLLVALPLAFSSCSKDEDPITYDPELIGSWEGQQTDEDGSVSDVVYTFEEEGEGSIKSSGDGGSITMSVEWYTKGSSLYIVTFGQAVPGNYSVNGDVLTVNDGEEVMTLTKM